jgi:O-antigen/teichoic acid export membrane protein
MNVGVSWLVVLMLLASAVNYASNLVFSRVLDVAGFGELTALLSLAVVLAVPAGAAQTVIAERVAFYAADGRFDTVRYLIRHAAAHVGLIALVVGVLYVLLIPVVVWVLDLRQPGPAIALAPVVVLSFVVPVALGALQGLDRFTALGVMIVGISLAGIAFGVPWAAAGGGAGGAIAGRGLGMVVVLLGAMFLLRKFHLARGSGAARSGLRRRFDVRTASASAAFVAFAVISNLDILLAKAYLDPDQVGVYAAAATVGKIVTFLPGTVAVVMVPNAARAHRASGSSSQVLRLAALLVTATAALAAVPAALAPEFFVNLMFGSGYEAASDAVLPIVFAGGGLAMINLLVVYSVAIQDRRWFLVLLLGVGLQIIGISAFHGSPTEVAIVQAFVLGAVLLVNERWFHSLLVQRS